MNIPSGKAAVKNRGEEVNLTKDKNVKITSPFIIITKG